PPGRPGTLAGPAGPGRAVRDLPPRPVLLDPLRLLRLQHLHRRGAGLGHLAGRSEEHTSELQSRFDLVCRLLLEKKKNQNITPSDVVVRLLHCVHALPALALVPLSLHDALPISTGSTRHTRWPRGTRTRRSGSTSTSRSARPAAATATSTPTPPGSWARPPRR